MVPVGYRPILWHVMRYYAHFGHRDFILCLGYRGDAIKEYFLRYEEALSNDFVLSDGGRQIELLGSRHPATGGSPSPTPGSTPPIGERLRRGQRRHLEGEELFLANYGDTLTDAPLDRLVDGGARERGRGDAAERPAAVLVPRRRRGRRPEGPGHRRDTRSPGSGSTAAATSCAARSSTYLGPSGQDLVDEPFERLADEGQLRAIRYDGFWSHSTRSRTSRCCGTRGDANVAVGGVADRATSRPSG